MIAGMVMGLIGLSAGFVVAGGVVALVTMLGGITRFIGISRTAVSVHIYEWMVLIGALTGNYLTIYYLPLPVGIVLTALIGFLFGMFVGGWIMALAEVAKIFPVFSRRLGITWRMEIIVIAIAVGKVAGCLYHFYKLRA